MATLQQTQDRIDAWLDARREAIDAVEESYQIARGRYFQGLATHTDAPDHQANADDDRPADRRQGRPTDQGESWEDIFDALTTGDLPAALRLDVYEQSRRQGRAQGYVLTATMKYRGQEYETARNVGPETGRAFRWLQVEE